MVTSGFFIVTPNYENYSFTITQKVEIVNIQKHFALDLQSAYVWLPLIDELSN